MEDQNTQQTNQNEQEPLSQRTPIVPVSPQQTVQSTINPVQNPGLTFVPQQATATEPVIVSSSVPLAAPLVTSGVGRKHRGLVEIILLILFVLIVVAASGYLLITHNNKAAKFTYDHTVKNNQPSSGTDSTVTSAATAEQDVSFGAAATSGGFSVKVADSMPNPQTTGDAPDTGMKYLEVDFTQTNTSTAADFRPGGFSYLATSGKEYIGADTTGPSSVPNKKVQIVGKELESAEYLAPNQTDTRALIFQVPEGDTGTGKLIWRATPFDITSQKLATFDLY